jgi:hypothetical protein
MYSIQMAFGFGRRPVCVEIVSAIDDNPIAFGPI